MTFARCRVIMVVGWARDDVRGVSHLTATLIATRLLSDVHFVHQNHQNSLVGGGLPPQKGAFVKSTGLMARGRLMLLQNIEYFPTNFTGTISIMSAFYSTLKQEQMHDNQTFRCFTTACHECLTLPVKTKYNEMGIMTQPATS